MLPSQLPLFICAALEGSFSAAGRKLGISAAAVSKGVAALEKQTGVRLFHRNTRQFSLTEDGASLYQRVAPLLSELEESIDGLAEQNRSPAGKLRVNLPDSFGRKFIMPHISEFLTLYPDIELDVVLSDRVLDIIDEALMSVLVIKSMKIAGWLQGLSTKCKAVYLPAKHILNNLVCHSR